MNYSSGRYPDNAREDLRVAARSFKGVAFTINLRSLKAVANGGTADILVGTMVDKHESWAVAVKVFKTVLSDTEKMLLVRELDIARQVSRRHHFITPFIGTANIGRETSIVSLYMENGNLLEYIKAHKDVDRKKLILQVADAVVFLHSSEGLVHGDLKCANVLISDFGNALLADFGLSTFIEKAESTATTATDARTKYTLRFAAPELLLDSVGHPRRRSKTCQTDVYAFGMLVLEALTEQSPWSGLTEPAVLFRVYSGNVPAQPTTDGAFAVISHAWWDMLKHCWINEPGSRPTMKAVLDDLTKHSHLPVRIVEPPDGYDGIYKALCMPRNDRLALITYSKERLLVWIYDVPSNQTIHGSVVLPRDAYYGPLDLLGASSDGQQVIACTQDAIIRWDVASVDEVHIQRSNDAEPYVIPFAMSPDTTRIAANDEDDENNGVLFWDSTTAKPLDYALRGDTHDVSCMAFSPDGTHIVSGTEEGGLVLWDALTGEPLANATEADCVNCLSYFPNGQHIVSGSWDRNVRIWDASTLKLERTLPHPQYAEEKVKGIVSVSVSPLGTHIVSASHTAFQVWDTKVWEPFGTPKTTERVDYSGYRSVAFSSSGKYLISQSSSQVVQIWDLVV